MGKTAVALDTLANKVYPSVEFSRDLQAGYRDRKSSCWLERFEICVSVGDLRHAKSMDFSVSGSLEQGGECANIPLLKEGNGVGLSRQTRHFRAFSLRWTLIAHGWDGRSFPFLVDVAPRLCR